MAIKILREGLPVVGLAKIGVASAKDSKLRGAPIKFDHIELVGLEKDQDGIRTPDIARNLELIRAGAATCGGCNRSKHLAQVYDEPELEKGFPTELPIMLAFNDLELVLPNRLAYYKGRTAYCTGDGEEAMRLSPGKGDAFGPAEPYGPCGNGCPDFISRRCKPHGRLRFLLANQPHVGGCYEFRTTSWASLANLTSSLEFIRTITGGTISWVPLVFDIVAQTVQPADGARASTAWIARIRYEGTPQALIESVQRNLELRAPVVAEIRKLEASLSRGWDLDPTDVEEFREEFDHENLAAEAPVIDIPTDASQATSNPTEAPPAPVASDSGQPEPSWDDEAEDPDGENPFDPEPADDEPPKRKKASRKKAKKQAAPAAEPEVVEPEDTRPEAIRALVTKEQRLELWHACLDRANAFGAFDSTAAAEKCAADILRAVLSKHGYQGSVDVPEELCETMIADVANAKRPA